MATQKSLPQDSSRHRKRRRKWPPGVVVKNGKWYVRFRYVENGQRRAVWRECAPNATDAREVRAVLKAEFQTHGARAFKFARKTWGDLVRYYRDEYLVPAVYVDGEKVSGRRSLNTPNSYLRTLTALIGERTQLSEMDFEFWRQIRHALLRQPTRPTRLEPNGHQRSITDVNRALSLARTVFTVARKRLRWVHHDPFGEADEPLVTPAKEKKRRRVMSFEEEESLLLHAVGPRAHLRLLVLGLPDTLLRSDSEFYKLRVKDFDLAARKVVCQQLNTKLLKSRGAPLSQRFAEEARRWIEEQQLGPEDRFFPYNSVKRSWSTLKRLAGVRDLRVKDMRRTGATRLLRAGHPVEEISQLLGHSTLEMTYEYFGLDFDTTQRAADLLDRIHAERAHAHYEAIH